MAKIAVFSKFQINFKLVNLIRLGSPGYIYSSQLYVLMLLRFILFCKRLIWFSMDNSSIGLGHCLLLPVSVEDKLLGVKHIFSPKVELLSGIVWGDLEFLLYFTVCFVASQKWQKVIWLSIRVSSWEILVFVKNLKWSEIKKLIT